MKIAIDISQIVHEGTGIATYTDQLVRNLLKIDSQNNYVLFGTTLRKMDFLESYFQELKSAYKNLTRKFLYIPPTVSEFLGNRMHKFPVENFLGKIDVFHSSDWIQPPAKAKKITTVHDLLVYEYPDISHPKIVDTQKRRLKWVKKECDMILADSAFTKNQLTKILHIDSGKVETVYPGISDEFKKATDEKITHIRQKYGLFYDYILSVGTLEPRKNLKTALEAFDRFLMHPLISTREKPIELVIVGKFGWGEKLKKVRNVRILGFVEEKDLPAIYSGAKLFVYPSLYEGFGFPILEAMACGCPVITSDRGSLKELAGDAAIIIDPILSEDLAVKMTQIFVDSDLQRNLTEKGKANAQKFNWEKTAKEVLSVYNKLVTHNL